MRPACAAETTFEIYRELMAKWIGRIVPRRVRRGPFESKDDLLAEADYALWQVYRKYSSTRSTEEVCRIGTRAIERRMLDVWTASGRGRRRGWEDPAGELAVVGPRGRRRVVRFIRPRILSVDGSALLLPVREPDALERLSLREQIEEAAPRSGKILARELRADRG